ncbi:MAG: hypothetical protein Ct9H90mP6_04000 [Gammaproteobacteria bacterium]|nr:MAG: hypothetical protein Ct9H90mP6_04000 [Gammaproteobacteria bacterium]
MGFKRKITCSEAWRHKKSDIPLDNKADLKEIPDVITDKLEIIPVEWIDEVILHSLESQPKAINKSSSFKSKSKKSTKTVSKH